MRTKLSTPTAGVKRDLPETSPEVPKPLAKQSRAKRVRLVVKRMREGRKAKMGAPSLFQPAFVHIAYTMCAEAGVTIEMLAETFKVDTVTIKHWMRDRSDFFNAIRSGWDIFNCRAAEKALLKMAMGYEVEEIRTEDIEITQRKKGMAPITVPARRITRSIRHISPNVVSLIFLLTNRDQRRWKNTRYIEGNPNGGLPGPETKPTYDFTKLNDEDIGTLRSLVAKTVAVADVAGDRPGVGVQEPSQIRDPSLAMG